MEWGLHGVVDLVQVEVQAEEAEGVAEAEALAGWVATVLEPGPVENVSAQVVEPGFNIRQVSRATTLTAPNVERRWREHDCFCSQR